MTPILTQLITNGRTSSSKHKLTVIQNFYHRHQTHIFGSTLAVIDPRRSGKNNDGNISNQSNKKNSKYRKQGGASSYKFVDAARVKVTGGTGGKGCISYESVLGSKYKKRPDGGHGGNGGDVIIVADANEQSMNMSTHHYRGQDGTNGGSRQRHGRNGKDKIIRVPCGVVVKRVLGYDEIWDEENGIVQKISSDDYDGGDNGSNEENDGAREYRFQNDCLINPEVSLDKEFNDDIEENGKNDEYQEAIQNNSNQNKTLPFDYEDIVNTGVKSEDDGMYHWSQDDDDELVSSSSAIDNLMEREKVTVTDLDKAGSYIVIASGGRGGVGNCAYAKRQFVPHLISKAAEKSRGISGDEVYLELELKLIADIGLVGFPNAGKSSLLAAMSKAKPEIAPYPFTTLHPLVGCVEYRDGFRALVADVPGLIDGAAEGRGRGHNFLKHLERTKALLYIVDAAGVDGRDPINDLAILVDEIISYGDGDMMRRPALVVANKLDLIPDNDLREEILLALSDVATEKGILFNSDVLGISAGVSGEGLGGLSTSIRDLVELGEINRLKTNEEWATYT